MQSLLSLLLLSWLPSLLADRLDQVLASAIFPPSSWLCQGAGSTTSFNTTYESTFDISHWDVNTKQYEEDVFQVDMIHDDVDPDRSWVLRIGKGGQVASFRVAVGEAIANQANAQAVWNDLVQQMVAVSGRLNTPSTPNFIHQSGPYMRDEGMPPPFYSPMVAMDCSGNQCSSVNWGQQAHVPTSFDSPILYYTRYRDCNNGVIEYDIAMHHFGQDRKDMYDYFNTPWTGVRTSTFRDMMIASTSGILQHHFPLDTFGGSVRDLEETGGFTTFAEDLELTSDTFDFGFCVDTTRTDYANVNCDASNPNVVPFQLQVKENDKTWTTGHAATYGVQNTVSMRLCDLKAPITIGKAGFGNPYDGVYLTNDRTGYTFHSDFIIHYCWSDGRTYLASNVTAAVLNQEFRLGDTISIKYVTSGKPFNAQHGLTFVHGRNPEYYSNSFYRAKSRIRFGTTNNRRDGTVWTTNFIGSLYPTETYFSRKYMITDRLNRMESASAPLVGETYEDVVEIAYMPDGETIKLWMNDEFFGASIGAEPCGAQEATLACEGKSLPTDGFRPWFFISCGNRVVTTRDPYYFATAAKKPYMCSDDNDLVTRATWKLLGYFPSTCSVIGIQEFQSGFCDLPATESPTTISPTTISPTTISPTTIPPTTIPPTTITPETDAPKTDAPETDAPKTEAPETQPPETEKPETDAPETEPPVTEPPETEPPETEPPVTEPPETEPPETEPPVTEAPETEPPETEPPETEAPETKPPDTEPPETEPPTDAPVICENDAEWTFTLKKGQVRDCTWVAERPYGEDVTNIFERNNKGKLVSGEGRCNRRGDNGFRARNACPVACGTCDCVDSQEWKFVQRNGKERTCAWIAQKPYNDILQTRGRCFKVGVDGTPALGACPFACDTC